MSEPRVLVNIVRKVTPTGEFKVNPAPAQGDFFAPKEGSLTQIFQCSKPLVTIDIECLTDLNFAGADAVKVSGVWCVPVSPEEAAALDLKFAEYQEKTIRDFAGETKITQ